ncbi:MAG: S1 RNA-binding domain-containing protein [Planctomycetota bacterium]|nr:S1 RNA-binding domain-containing protein [Planctomycetota bacterium]
MFWELRNPGRDARGRFALPEGNEGVRGLADVQPGQVLRGVVTNLASFGAFVDLGIPQEGLVHISELSHRYVQDPSVLLNVGQAVRVKVLGVDAAKKRISLSIKALEDPAAARGRGGRPARAQGPREPRGPRPPRAPRAPRAGAAPAEGAAAGAAAGGGERPPGRGRGERAGPGAKDRPGRDGRPRRKREDDGPRVKPEFAKFFDKGSKAKGRRDNKKRDGPRRADEANRDEVREILRKQESGGSTLGDLLKKAGLGDDAGE